MGTHSENSSHKCNCHQVSEVVFGTRADRTDGIAWLAIRNFETLHGTKENPGGMVKTLDEMKSTVLKAAGAFTVLNVLIALAPFIYKLIRG